MVLLFSAIRDSSPNILHFRVICWVIFFFNMVSSRVNSDLETGLWADWLSFGIATISGSYHSRCAGCRRWIRRFIRCRWFDEAGFGRIKFGGGTQGMQKRRLGLILCRCHTTWRTRLQSKWRWQLCTTTALPNRVQRLVHSHWLGRDEPEVGKLANLLLKDHYLRNIPNCYITEYRNRPQKPQTCCRQWAVAISLVLLRRNRVSGMPRSVWE